MSFNNWLPIMVLATSLVPAILIFMLAETRHSARTILNLLAALLKIIFVGIMLNGVFNEREEYYSSFNLVPGITFAFQADALAMLFITLSSILWLITTVYAIGYLENAPHRSRFFGFFSLCVASTMGISMADNLFTFFIFYELLTLSTYPLVVHRGTEKAINAGGLYLRYTITSGAVLLIAIIWLYSITGTQDFAEKGIMTNVGEEHHFALTIIFILFLLAFGVKAALVPLHGWLPQAMVAPAPVSALLHAVAVVKAGAFGIVRVVYDIYGVHFAHDLGVLVLLTVLASITIIYGSIRALFQDDLKKRLAFSTVSQVSYIALGVSLFGPLGIIGGVVHLVHQGIMKITLFFCAGNFAETLGIHKVSEMQGVGKKMPLTMGAFTVGAMGMIGVPPVAGFVSKWYLGMGALEANMGWVIGVLIISSLLNAAYFLPILYMAWFKPMRQEWPHEVKFGRHETALMLLVPPLITAALSLLAGLLAFAPFSPLTWATLISYREFY
jgi:multicomponent Na+:H+ antiporter subunit D